MIIYLAALQSVPTELYEASAIDGANALRKFWSITLPMISPVILLNLIIGIINSFQIFTSVYIMTQGGPNNGSLFFVLYIYRHAFQYFNIGYASALAWILFVVIMLFTLSSSEPLGHGSTMKAGLPNEREEMPLGLSTSTRLAPQTSHRSSLAPPKRPFWKYCARRILYVILIVGSIPFVLPLIFMLSTSVKSKGEVLLVPIRWIPNHFLWGNYYEAMFGLVPLYLFMWNTVKVVAGSLIGDVLVCALVGYAFARLRAPGRDFLFLHRPRHHDAARTSRPHSDLYPLPRSTPPRHALVARLAKPLGRQCLLHFSLPPILPDYQPRTGRCRQD